MFVISVSKSNDRVVPKLPRYDNFLKSAKRSDGLTGNVTEKTVPNATITKYQHLRQIGEANGIDSNDENDVPGNKYLGRASTHFEILEDFPNTSRNSADRFSSLNEVDHENVQAEPTEITITKKVNVLQDIQIEPPTTISSQIGMSFEERILKELSDLKKTQQSFEARIEARIKTFSNDQLRMQYNSRPRFHGNGESHMFGNHMSGVQYQSRQYGGIRNEIPIRHRESVFQERFADDFEDFEELDQHFPVNRTSHVEELEFNIRKDLEFQFRLHSRLNELGGANYKKCIREKMKYLFTNKVLERYTWNGTVEKRGFKNLKALNNLILRSVRQRCPNTKRDEYKDYMMEWLKHAKSRQREVTYTYPEQTNFDDSYDEDDDQEINN
ncbi:hypothetical protein Bhyg_07808 [Pseudolycoriella hygida]|uniref:DUF4806 domain-containing protein n=1 Tax=Pseudolycoriella hygida TaxID=35572 RepID=A0A9Q0S2C5_9DIPT|nr:hypothetical protein Bhyg_07808 [Pseudolycoriella hygida]